jgi:hypothetical protein
MPAGPAQFTTLINLLIQSSDVTGLRVNYNKTTLVPINIPPKNASHLATNFGCKLESLPFTYLGLPLGTTTPSVDDLMPLVSRLDKRLFRISSIMTYTGRLTLLNSTLTAIPIFAMCCLELQVNIFVHFEKIGRQVLWAKKIPTSLANVLLNVTLSACSRINEALVFSI